jgi:hypothetical protein
MLISVACKLLTTADDFEARISVAAEEAAGVPSRWEAGLLRCASSHWLRRRLATDWPPSLTQASQAGITGVHH